MMNAMNKSLAIGLFLMSTAFYYERPAAADVILSVGEGRDCPEFTKPAGDGYCKAFVTNEFTGAYLNGSCPPGSGPVGQGYCMYDY